MADSISVEATSRLELAKSLLKELQVVFLGSNLINSACKGLKSNLIAAMRLPILLSFLAFVDGLKDGVSGADREGLCASSPLLILNEDASCRPNSTPVSPEASTNRLARHGTETPASSNETGWEGPAHCMRGYCLYSNRRFAGGGIVVITTAENAKRIAEIPEITTARSGPPPFFATEVPGKGNGLVANRTIRRGEVIMTWQPTFVIHRRLPDDLRQEELHHVLNAALLKLPAPRRRAFLKQLGQFGGHRVSDILLTNSFQTVVGAEGGGEEGHHHSNFPNVSLYNHDCRPNTAFYIDDRLTHHTHAVRDISAGEELTLTYMNPFETFAARQAHIQQSWGFKCTCQHCTMGEDRIRESDARLYEIDEMEAELGNFASPKASVEMVERLLEVYELERLDVKVHGAYVLAALNYNLFGDAKKAKKYAKLAVETGIVEFGPDADDVAAMRELARDPKAHFTWRKRV